MEDGVLQQGSIILTNSIVDSEIMQRRGKLMPGGGGGSEKMIKKKSEKVGAWSKEDEITILKGLIKLKTEKGKIRFDYVQLYDSIKQSLAHKSATPLHLQKKIKCLREKYKNNFNKSTRTWSIPHEEELFYLSDEIWGKDDHQQLKIPSSSLMNQQQLTIPSSSLMNQQHLTLPSSSLMNQQQLTLPSSSLMNQQFTISDTTFVGDLGLALTTMSRNQSNQMQVALQQFELVSQSLSIRKSYANQILHAHITLKEGLSEQKIARSYFDTKIQHAQLVSDAYNASHSFGGSLVNIVSDCVLKEDATKVMNEGNCPPATIGCRKPITGKPSGTSLKSVREMCHSQERKKKKKRKIENPEKHRDSSIQSQLEMENQSAVAYAKNNNESAKSSDIHTLSDGLTVEVMVKGKADGKVASLGKQIKIHFIAKLRDTGCIVGSTIGAAPHQFCLGYEKVLKGLNIGIEGMHVGEKRRLTIPPSLGPGRKAKPPIMPDSWLLYEVELVDICE
ncbi:uncharacterized protein LOC107008897 isoform X2 [Solanum pennellii]|uniref:peptidylprolyl isomerase n=1 Tax=Solanum pennellii TaxID=28526 RepID=A0ABM1V542_SOLPN|nr:uncharacterized protein LOC107008897 isoform X2 [Solanum pennellii]